MLFKAGTVSPTPPESLWKYDNLLALDVSYRIEAQSLVQSRLPNYSKDHCFKLFGGSPYEFLSRCVLDEMKKLIGVMAYCVGKIDTVEIVAFVAKTDGIGIGRFLMQSFVSEMKTKKKSSILTYIEPSAFPFFSRFDFTKAVPARSLYEKITSKYVAAIFMYKNLLEPIPLEDRHEVMVGDRLLITVDGTLIPRQAIVKEMDNKNGLALVHYYFWNTRNDEWIYTHSPRIRYDIPLPPEAPKNKGENQVTISEAKTIVESEMEKMKRTINLEECGYWPKGIKKKAEVQVLIEGEWIRAQVINKNDMYCYCEFEHNGSQWHQDFPRESIRLPEIGKTVVELCMEKKVAPKKRKRTSEAPKSTSFTDMDNKKIKRTTKKPVLRPIELSPLKAVSGIGPSDRFVRKQKREGLVLEEANDSLDSMFGNSPETADTSPSPTRSEHTCSVCKDDHGFVMHCALCSVAVHPACYLIDNRKFFPSKEWFCDTCVNMRLGIRRRDRSEPTCICCGFDRNDGGAMVQTVDYKYIHVRCGLMLELDFHPVERKFARVALDSPKTTSKVIQTPCSVCGLTTGPQISCWFDSCNIHAHLSCMQNWGVDLKVNSNGDRVVNIFCPSHNGNAK